MTIFARATQSLSRFNLDFAGESVGSVSVNGRTASWTRDGDELVITPRRATGEGAFRSWSGSRISWRCRPSPSDDPTSTALFTTPDGTATAGQPDLAHYVYPSNDHPSDKASYTFRLDVPSDIVAVANGVPTGRREHGGRTTWSYLQRQPMATELVQLAVGGYDLLWAGRHRGVPIRNVIAPSLRDVGDPAVALTPQHLDWMTERAGRYPFDIYGSLIVDAELGFALETQTISLYDKVWFTEYGQGTWDPTMVHELSHEWFGNSVSPEEWSDLWLNEGHASWYEFVYAEEKGFLAEDTEGYPDETGYATLEELMQAVYAHGDQWRADDGPVAAPSSPDTLFDFNRYHGGALVLYALREKIGTRAFDRLEREWVRRYRDESVGHRGLHRARIAGRPSRPARLPARLALRDRRPRRCRTTRTGPSTRSQPGAAGGALRPGRAAAYSVMTVSSCEYAGAQQQRSLSGASSDAQSLCLTPGAITTVSPGPTSRSTAASRSRPRPSVKK